MRFQFVGTDTTLTKPVQTGGCGLTAGQLAGVTVWQSNFGYEFCYHTGYHGEGNTHYVYIREAGSTQVKGCSRVFINGPKAGQCSNDGRLKNAFVTDACRVVSNNQATFLLIAGNQ